MDRFKDEPPSQERHDYFRTEGFLLMTDISNQITDELSRLPLEEVPALSPEDDYLAIVNPSGATLLTATQQYHRQIDRQFIWRYKVSPWRYKVSP